MTSLLPIAARDLAEKLTTMIEVRNNSLNDGERPPYRVLSHCLRPEGNAGEMIRQWRSIDKTKNLKKLIDPATETYRYVLHLQYPRRFGKSYALEFFRVTMSDGYFENKTQYSEFIKRLKALEKGEDFIGSKLHPSIMISLLDVKNDKGMRTRIIRSFETEGVVLERQDTDGSLKTVGELFEEGIEKLSSLWKNAIDQSNGVLNEKNVSEKVIVLIDEFDNPWREGLPELSRTRATTSQRQEARKALERSLEETKGLLNTIKRMLANVYKNRIYTVLVVSLLSITGIGLSGLELVETCRDPAFAGVVGITGTEMDRAFSNLWREIDGGMCRVTKENLSTAFKEKKNLFSDLLLATKATENSEDCGWYSYFKQRYNGFQFTACKTHEKQMEIGGVFSPRDLYHFLGELELGFEDVLDWRKSWIEEFLTLFFAINRYVDAIVDAFWGDTIRETCLQERLPLNRFFEYENDFSALLLLLLELGFLKIESVREDNNRIYTLLPSSTIALDMLLDNTEVLGHLRRDSEKLLSDHEIRELQSTQSAFNDVPPTTCFDGKMFEYLERSVKWVATVASETGYDLFREYECQHYFVKLLRRRLLTKEPADEAAIQVLQEKSQTYESLNNVRTDVFLVIGVLAAAIELKRITDSVDSTKANTALSTAWRQATKLVTNDERESTEAFRLAQKKVCYAVVYCVFEGRVEILLRRGAVPSQETLEVENYEDYVLKNTGVTQPSWEHRGAHRVEDLERNSPRPTQNPNYEDR
jgi:hypothetical protein